jgi:DNA-binding transcriptional regulator YbjK
MARKKRKQTLLTATAAELDEFQARCEALTDRMNARGVADDDPYRLLNGWFAQAIDGERIRRKDAKEETGMKTHSIAREFNLNQYDQIATWLNGL